MQNTSKLKYNWHLGQREGEVFYSLLWKHVLITHDSMNALFSAAWNYSTAIPFALQSLHGSKYCFQERPFIYQRRNM